MQTFLLVNSVFKTTEYKLLASGNLKITDLSRTGKESTKTFPLNSIAVEERKSTATYMPFLVLFLGILTVTFAFYTSKEIAFLQNNLMSIISFLSCTFIALAILSKPLKSIIYRDSFSNKILLKLNQSISNHAATKEFTEELNKAIDDAKEVLTSPLDLTPKAQLQFENHSANVDALLNSGLIDEVLYKRICNSMDEKIFDNREHHHTENNVIYLKR